MAREMGVADDNRPGGTVFSFEGVIYDHLVSD